MLPSRRVQIASVIYLRLSFFKQLASKYQWKNQSESKKMLGRTTSWHHMLRHLDCYYLTLHTYLTAN